MKDKIVFGLTPSNFITRWPCDVCGGETGKVMVLCEAVSDNEDVLRICERCLEAGPESWNEKLNAHAKALDDRAARTRAMVGRIEAPPFVDWEAASDQAVAVAEEGEI